MAKVVIKNPYLSLGGTDYSAYVESVELPLEAEDVDLTTGGSAGWHEGGQGIKRGNVTFNLRMDSDMSGFNAAIFAVFNHATVNTWAFEIRQQNAAVSTTNRKYTGTLLVIQAGLSLKVGGAFEKSFTLPTTAAVAEATS